MNSGPQNESAAYLQDTKEWLDPRFRGLRNSRVFILVFDICSPESFHHVKQLRQQILDSTSKPPLIVVVGNKRDQQKHRFVPRHVLSLLVKKSWKCGYLECSARNNWHILLLFKELLISTTTRSRSHTSSICLQGALHRERCSIM
ncbi:ras-like protein family member 10A isoform X2 [Eleutherodactylus coqui]|uniref:Uncharacterized protein n=1 Tax=Eleutherodactylus coqui TaxID=57060 RepID=A0A8J6FFR5_ELECQ|nr:hypothetical protein GDO78_007153 [Eleutherodactylus coqui]